DYQTIRIADINEFTFNYKPQAEEGIMALRRVTALAIQKALGNIRKPSPNASKFVIMAVAIQDKKNNKIVNLQLERPEDKPLVVLLSWLMAKRKHIYKYADLYLRNGFDVLNVSVTPWQLLWPTKGTQMVAKDLLRFIDLNTKYAPLVLHGFSVGGYVWGEVLVNIAAERERYSNVVDRIAGQIWDSAADITEISVGLPIAVFPRNSYMQTALRQYMLYHLKAFDKVATRHYIRSSQMFHTNLVQAPAQFIISKADPIGTEASNTRVRESWESMGMKVYWKCFEKSPHVGHFRAHQKEYIDVLNSFLETINLRDMRVPEKVKAKL
ncbi:hypothetical protein NQ318_015769, partial [Aromia moschata]